MDFVNKQLHEFIREELLPEFHPSVIYHYTNIGVLGEFFKREADFYCTHCQALNDDEEFLLGLQYAKYYIEHRSKISESAMADFVDHLYDLQQEQWRYPWVMSFSTEKDSLFQWVSYTDKEKGGYAVGFDYEMLRNEAARRIKLDHEDYYIYLLPCLYIKHKRGKRITRSNEQADKLLDFLLRPYVDRLKDLFKAGMEGERRLFESSVLLFASMIKNSSFAHERECRLVVQPRDERLALKKYKLVGEKPRLPSRIFSEQRKLRKSIVSIGISPHGNKRVLRTSAELYVAKYALPIKLYDSASSYNGLH